MPIIAQIIIAIISFAISYALRPKPPSSNQTTDPESVTMPSVSEGVEIPVLFGIVWSTNTTLVWWGDLSIEEGQISV